jgi:activator of HSP90 ATPase
MQLMSTRRNIILLLGGSPAVFMRAQTAKGRTAIHQEVDYKASPARVYEALLDPKQFSAFTKLPAKIERQAGGLFKLFDGHIEGRNIDLTPNKMIVQAWREPSWRVGLYTIVKFVLTSRGSGTRVVFDQTGVPEEDWEHLNEGWPLQYWEPLRKFLDGGV